MLFPESYGPESYPMSVSSYRRVASECRPLVDAATKDIFRNNAFRIIGLPVDATAGEIRKRVDKLKIMEDLGEGHALHKSPFSLRPPPTVDQIREAIQRIQDPEKRMVDEFFWFWPEEFGRSSMDPAIQAFLGGDCDTASKIWTLRESSHSNGAVATHNIALYWHFTSLEREFYAANNDIGEAQEVIAETSWRNAVRRWRYLLSDEALWETLDARARQLNDPRLSMDFSARMRAAMPLAFAKIHCQLALSYVERRRLDLGKIQVSLMRELAPKAEVVEMAADLVLATAKHRMQTHSDNVKDEAARSPEKAATLARTLIAPALLLFEVIELLFGEDDYPGKDLLTDTLSVCVECAVIYQRKTEDDHTFVDLLERIHPLSENAELTARISKNLKIGRKNLEVKLAAQQSKRPQNENTLKEPKNTAPHEVKKKKSWFTKLLGKISGK